MKKKDYLIACLSFVLTFCVGVGVMGCKDGKETTNQNTGTNTNEQGALVGGIVGGLISGIVNGNNVLNNNNNQTPPNQTPPEETPVLPQEGPLVLDESQNLVFNDGLKESGEKGVIQAINGASVSLSGAGSVIAEEENGNAIAVWANGADITIQSGAYGQLVSGLQEEYPLIYASNGGNVYIEGGTFKSATPASTLVCEQGSSIIVTGGKFYQYDPSTQATISINSIEQSIPTNGIIIPDGYKVETIGDWCYVVEKDFYYDRADGNYYIRNAEGLVKFEQSINADSTIYDDKTIVLKNDIDLSGIEWNPIHIWDNENSTRITLDGDGHTISNMSVSGTEKVGFFGGIARNITIKDIIFDNASVIASGRFAGVVIGHQYNDVELINVDVINSKVSSENGIRVGGLVGFSLIHEGGTTLQIKDCDVANTEVSGMLAVAGLVGALCDYDELNLWSIKNSSVVGCTFAVTVDRADSIKYASAFATEGAQYPHTYQQSNQYFKAMGNKESGNVYNYPDNETVLYVNNANDLKDWAKNALSEEYAKIQTVYLTKDIKLGGTWTPIDLWSAENVSPLTIDGNGHKISNMTVNGGSYAGFIGRLARNAKVTIQDLTFENASVVTSGSWAGVVIGYQYGDVTLNNIDVIGAEVKTTAEKGIRLGGLIGGSLTNDGAKLTVKNCDVTNTTITGYHNVAGLVGSLMDYDEKTSQWNITNNTVSGCVFKVTTISVNANKYLSAFAVEGGYGYPHTYEQSNEYFVGNIQSGNSFCYIAITVN